MRNFKFPSIPTVALLGLAASAPAAMAAVDSKAQSFWDNIPITNSMVFSWIIAAILILLIRWAIKKPTVVPHRGQAFVEGIVQAIIDLIEPIVGKRMVRVTFPLLAALFLYILIQNWAGLLPGVGTLGWGKSPDGGFATDLFRPGNADLNTTLALAIVSMVAWVYYIIRYAGFKAIAYDLFGNKADRTEIPLAIFLGLFGIFFFVGLIEVISILFRPVSLSFRLFGNVYGGENLLHEMMALFPWGVPIPFYILELLIGLVQALVFTLLVAVYIGLVCNHEEEGETHS